MGNFIVEVDYLATCTFFGHRDTPASVIPRLRSVLVELIQLVSKVGSCDVDDMLLNTLGGIIGYVLFRFFHRIFFCRKSVEQPEKTEGQVREDHV